MRIIKIILVVFGLLAFCMPVAWGEALKGDSGSEARIAWIQEALDSGSGASKLWQYGWTGVYGATAIVEGVNANDNVEIDEKDDQFDSTVNAITSLLGLGNMVYDPLTSYSASEKLKSILASNDMDQKTKLAAAERLLTSCAKREEKGRSWKTHVLAGIVSIMAGIAVASDDSRGDDGLVMFASSMLVSEIQIFTMPTQAIDDLRNYKNKKFTKFHKKRINRFYVNAIPGGLKFKYLF